jgi:hypothetical protein
MWQASIPPLKSKLTSDLAEHEPVQPPTFSGLTSWAVFRWQFKTGEAQRLDNL